MYRTPTYRTTMDRPHRWQQDEAHFDPAVLLTVVLGVAAATYIAISF